MREPAAQQVLQLAAGFCTTGKAPACEVLQHLSMDLARSAVRYIVGILCGAGALHKAAAKQAL